MKIKWKVSEAPTGRHRGFNRRSWPTAYFDNEMQPLAAQLLCENEYYPPNVKTGNHKELTVMVTIQIDDNAGWEWTTLTKHAKTLAEAKELVAAFYKKYPQHVPSETKE